MGHCRTRESPRSGWALALVGAVVLCLVAIPAQALVVEINLGWGYTAGADTDLADYNLQEGSIIQVIMYNSATGVAPGPNANNNFEIVGQYSGSGIAAEPFPGTEPANVPTDNTIYDPFSIVEDGHVMAYTTHIGPTIPDNENGFNWYNVVAQFEILGTYDRLYLRVFGATEFNTMEVVSSYWGLSAVQNGTNIIDTWFVDPIDDVVANQKNYFEVIPEPGSLALIVLGGAGLLAGYRRRQKPPSASRD